MDPGNLNLYVLYSIILSYVYFIFKVYLLFFTLQTWAYFVPVIT